MLERAIAGTFIRWTFAQSACARGWWLVTSLYLVVVAELTPFQLVFVGTAQGLLSLVSEVPAGVLADTFSRKWSLVAAHVLSGAGMLITGLVTSFPALVATQMLWGLGWAFSSGADVAWLTDEMRQPGRTPRVLTASARWGLVGGFAGTLAFGLLAWISNLELAIVAGGCSMLGLGLWVALRFPERHFTPEQGGRWRVSASILRRGVTLARRDREILVVLAATVLVNGVAEGGRLWPKHLVDLGLPGTADPIAWLTGLGLATMALGAVALRAVESRIDGTGVARRVYALACMFGAAGLLMLATAPNSSVAMAGILVVGGIAMSVTRAVGVIWVNRRVTSDVRATVQSFLAQAEYLGEIVIGFGLAVLAARGGIVAGLYGSCVLMALTAWLVARSKPSPEASLDLERVSPGVG